jgi:hypothetical protein
MAFTAQIFTKLTIIQYIFVYILRMEFYPNRTKIWQKFIHAVKQGKVFTALIKKKKTRSYSAALCADLPHRVPPRSVKKRRVRVEIHVRPCEKRD